MFRQDEYIVAKTEFDNMKKKYNIQTWPGAGVNDSEGVELAIANGAELITCNNPDVMLDLLRKRGYHKQCHFKPFGSAM